MDPEPQSTPTGGAGARRPDAAPAADIAPAGDTVPAPDAAAAPVDTGAVPFDSAPAVVEATSDIASDAAPGAAPDADVGLVPGAPSGDPSDDTGRSEPGEPADGAPEAALDVADGAATGAADDAAAAAVSLDATPDDASPTGAAEEIADAVPASPTDAAPRAAGAPGPPAVAEAFRAFYAHLGPTLCGAPVGPLVDEDGIPTQYFEHVALESPMPGQVRLKPIGAAVWEGRRRRSARPLAVPAPVVADLTDQLARHPSRAYAARPLTHVRYLVIHATGAPAHVGPHAIARAHVDDNGWPGIGYHFVVGADGAVYRTQDLTVVSHHVAQFNPVSVGIALAGDLAHADPPPAQIAAAADLVAQLCWDLGLPTTAVRGHREMVPTPCPGERFLGGWKPRLMDAVAERLDAQAARMVAGAPLAADLPPDAPAPAAQRIALDA